MRDKSKFIEAYQLKARANLLEATACLNAHQPRAAISRAYYSEVERAAVMRFLAEAPHVAPGVTIIAPRRSPAGRLNIVLEFPEGDTWDLTGELVGLSHRIEDETGVHLLLD